MRDVFDGISPIDYRYWGPDAAVWLSENAFTRVKLDMEKALIRVQAKHGLCDSETVAEVEEACRHISTDEVYQEESRIGHDIRALVNCITRKVSDKSKPAVHRSATSYDIIDSANAFRYGSVVRNVLVPAAIGLEKVLIKLVLSEDGQQLQIGRTHGQHAVPITFGFALAQYVSRVGRSIERLRELSVLPGKFSGAVGAYNASSLFFENPEEFESDVLAQLGLEPAEISTQVVPPEDLTRLLTEVVILSGILANLADDMRHLQRTEIGEVGEEFGEDQVGSSTMPQKRNPIGFENVKSCWEIVMPRVITVFMDQISEHQRDLTNSASSRTAGEIFAYVIVMTKRLARVMAKLRVDRDNLAKNLAMQKGLIVAEPLYILLSSLGHPSAHEKVRVLSLQAQREQRGLEDLVKEDPELTTYLSRMTEAQRAILSDPTLYTGIAAQKAEKVAKNWASRLSLEV